MPFKRGDFYYVDMMLPGYGRISRSTKSTSKRLALDIESTLRSLAVHGRHDVLDAMRDSKLSLPAVHGAYRANRLDHLLDGRKDLLLRDVAQAYLDSNPERRKADGVRKLMKYVPPNTRASWLLDPSNINGWITYEYRVPQLSAATEQREAHGAGALIRSVYGEHERRRVFTDVQLRIPKVGGRVCYLTPQNLAKLEAVAEGWWPLLELVVSTGLRRGEVLNLLRRDVDVDQQVVRVEAGKSRAARRTIPMSPTLSSKMDVWMSLTSGGPDDPLFPDVTSSRLKVAWKEIRERAGLLEKRFHDLRHTYGVAMVKAGIPLPELQRYMGHANIATTMIYAQYIPGRRDSEVKAAMKEMFG
jgi:integrase